MSDIYRRQVELHDGRMLAVFLNRDINLLVVDVIDADEDGGTEIVRMTLPAPPVRMDQLFNYEEERMEQPTFNAALARRVLTYIREHPEQHAQDTYVEPAEDSEMIGPEEEYHPDVLLVAESVKPTNGEYRCMTTACIAGWAVALAGPTVVRRAWDTVPTHLRDDDAWFETGRRLLGMSRAEALAVFLEMDEEYALEVLEQMISDAEAGA